MILDTNAISALVARDKNLIELISLSPHLAVTLVSLGEHSFGILESSKRKGLEQWLEAFLERTDVLATNRQTILHYASIRKELKEAGTPIPANDVWIAALARQHQLPIVSRDRHFEIVQNLECLGW
ncbi:MAG: PIN domain-containing protein [Verrucomicrobiota bacterium]